MTKSANALIGITQEQVMNVLDKGYEFALKGLPKFEDCYQLADNYKSRYTDSKDAIRALVQWQVLKCSTSGFLTSLGGFITLPVAIPINIASVLYIQLRMIATIAIIGGYDPKDDQVKTFVYMCLVGMSLTDAFKKPAINAVNKAGVQMLKRIPGEVLININKKVGFRLFTKFGEKGVINLVKLVPLLGGVAGGSLDFFSTKVIANRAVKMFLDERVPDMNLVSEDE